MKRLCLCVCMEKYGGYNLVKVRRVTESGYIKGIESSGSEWEGLWRHEVLKCRDANVCS